MSTRKRFEPILEPCIFFSCRKSGPCSSILVPTGIIPITVAVPPLAFSMLAKGGTATVIGMIPVGTKIELHGPDFLQEKKIQGSSMGSNRFRVDMPRYVDMYLNGKLKLDEMITREI